MMEKIPYMSLVESLIDQHLSNAAAHWRRASFHMMTGKTDWAIRCYEKAAKDVKRAADVKPLFGFINF